MPVRHLAEERAEDGPRRARQLVDQAGFLSDLEQPEPQAHRADQPQGQRDRVARALQRAGAHRLHVAVNGGGHQGGDQQDDEDEVHRRW